MRSCQACGDPISDHDATLRLGYCPECHDEKYRGILAPPYGPLVDDEDRGDDGLAEEGQLDNVMRVYEDDMPDVTQYGYRDTSLENSLL